MEGGEVERLGRVLNDGERKLAERYRALFALRNCEGEKMEEAVEVLTTLLENTEKKEGALLRHELAFALGQMQSAAALNTLERVLRNSKDSAIVRHEAAEAIAAIGVEPERCCAVLEEFATDASPEVRETCELALERFRGAGAGAGADESFGSVDPAPALDVKDDRELAEAMAAEGDSGVVAALEKIILDSDVPIARRYGALFALRNGHSVSSVCRALLHADSALLRHEVAYVLGQLRDEESVAALRECLANESEHPMVRHEAAEALGAVASDECVSFLVKFAKDREPIVAESCQIALDMLERKDTFEYLEVEA